MVQCSEVVIGSVIAGPAECLGFLEKFLRRLADAVDLHEPTGYQKVDRRLASNPIEACRLGFGEGDPEKITVFFEPVSSESGIAS